MAIGLRIILRASTRTAQLLVGYKICNFTENAISQNKSCYPQMIDQLTLLYKDNLL